MESNEAPKDYQNSVKRAQEKRRQFEHKKGNDCNRIKIHFIINPPGL